jgi:hypothetical protein
MMKRFVFAAALLSLTICSACSGNGKNGNGAARVSVSPSGVSVGLTLTQQFTATVTGVSDHSVTWALTQNGAACSPGCGTLSASGLYTAPTSLPANASVSITASAVANDGAFSTATAKVVPITVIVDPGANNFPVVVGVKQQFTATVAPDAAPQTVTWSLEQGGAACSPVCGTIDANGLYTAPAVAPNPAAVAVISTSTVQSSPVSSTTVNVTVAASRLSGASTYAFRASGFDAGGNFIALAGNFVTSADGASITGGTEDELTGSAHNRCTILGTSTFALDANDHGTLILRTSAGACSVNARTFKVALSQGGDGQMLEFDANSRTSGMFAQANSSKFKNSALPASSSFVFGLTGVDTTAKRTGYVGLLKPDGAGGITSGLIDIDDNGTVSPTANLNPTTSDYNINSDGSGTLILTTDVGTLDFDIYVVGGTTNPGNPLTLFVISSVDPQTEPAMIGTLVFRDPNLAGTNADLNASAISSLTGVSDQGTKVSLTSASGDGNGKINGQYDANNAGTIVAAKAFTGYTYACAASGRCTVNLLGDPAASPVVPPVQFALYLSAANRGFLLQNDSAHEGTAVYAGTMDPLKVGGFFTSSQLAGAFAAATTNSGTSSVSQVEANLLMESPGNQVFTLAGSQDITTSGGPNTTQALTGTFSMDSNGIGAITLTAPAAATYVLYAVDNPVNQNGQVHRFYIMNVTPTTVDPANTTSSIVFAER